MPKPLSTVVAEGDRRASLVALRDHLAAQLESSERDQAALARQLTMVLREIAELPNPAEESKVDDLANRRARRISTAAGQ